MTLLFNYSTGYRHTVQCHKTYFPSVCPCPKFYCRPNTASVSAVGHIHTAAVQDSLQTAASLSCSKGFIYFLASDRMHSQLHAARCNSLIKTCFFSPIMYNA